MVETSAFKKDYSQNNVEILYIKRIKCLMKNSITPDAYVLIEISYSLIS